MFCDSVISWAILLIIAIVCECALFKKISDAEEARKAAYRKEWEENGWG